MANVTTVRETVLPKIQAIVADSLALDEDEVLLESRLIPDLGADSLDFIDMIFMLEKTFNVKIREGEFNFLSRLDVSSAETLREGFLEPEQVEELVPWLPALASVEDKAKVTPGHLFGLISVETLCIMVERKLQTPSD